MRPEYIQHLEIELQPDAPSTIPVQITQQIRALITAGSLRPGDHLPSTRSLSQQLGISRGSVVTAYEQLAGEGLITTAHGSGTRIHPKLQVPTPSLPSQAREALSTPTIIDCAPGTPDTSKLIDPTWRAAWRAAATVALESPALLGSYQLRFEIAEHIRTVRGVVVDPSQIIVTAGAREGLQLILATLARFHHAHSIGVESPGYPSLRRIPPFFGYHLQEFPTDNEGIVTEQLDNTRAVDALIVTPNHQYPYGGALSATRRMQLANWAREQNIWLIEDDYSSELRYTGMALPPLLATAPDRCIFLGTFSSVLTPSIACGFLVVPAALLGEFREIREVFGQPVSALTQKALAEYLGRGALRRHIQRVRRTYMRRRDLVQQALAALPGIQLMPIDGGLHTVVLCQMPAQLVVARGYAAGIRVIALEDYWGGLSQENGIVFGFAGLDDATLTQVLQTLVAIFSSSQPHTMSS